MAEKQRFGSLSTEDIDEIEQNKDSKNTKKVISKSVNILRSYLREKGKIEQFEDLSIDELDALLKDFYGNARTEKGEKYKLSSFRQIRYGLSKFLATKNIDIDGGEFAKSNQAFKALSVNLVKTGKGDVVHKPPIARGDLQKLYNHLIACIQY
jgi:site-specific recombinase XerD